MLTGQFLLRPPGDADANQPRWAQAARWLPVWGVAIGVLYAVVFRLAWKAFGEYQGIRWLPVMAVLIVDLAVCGHRLLAGVISVASNRSAGHPPQSLNLTALLTLILVILGKFCLLTSLPIGTWQSPPSGSWGWDDTLSKLGPLYPSVIYRPLILAPLWGRWAMMLAMTIGRTSPGHSVRLQRMADGASLPTIFACWLIGAALTAIYCSGSGEHIARGVVLALVVMVIAYLASFVLARRAGGQTEATVATTGLITEMTFLVCYVTVSKSIYWY